MALIVEDGSGLTNSESYVAVADLTAYATKWGLTGFPSDTTKAEVLLRTATRALDSLYAFIGEKASDTQALEWPRTGEDAPAGVPTAVKNATCEMAYVYLTTDPLAPLGAGDSGLTELTKEVDALKVTKKWSDGAYQSATLNSTRKVSILLQDLLYTTPGGVMVEVRRG